MARSLQDRYDDLVFAVHDFLGKIEGFADVDLDKDPNVAPAARRLRAELTAEG